MDIESMFSGPASGPEDRLDENLMSVFEPAGHGAVSDEAINKLIKKPMIRKIEENVRPSIEESNGSRIREGVHNGVEGFWVFVEADAAASAAINLISKKKAASDDSDEKKELDAKKKAIQKGIDPNAALAEKTWNFRDVIREKSGWKGFDGEEDIEDSESEENEELDNLMGHQADDYADGGINSRKRGDEDRAEHELLPDGTGAIKSNQQKESFIKAYRSIGENVFSKDELRLIFEEVKESYTGKIAFEKHCRKELADLISVM